MSFRSLNDRIQNFVYDMTMRFLPFVIMGGFALFSYWLLKINAESEPPIIEKVKSHIPDYSFQKFIVTSLNEQGVTKYRLTGDKMVHYEDDASMDIVNPKARFFSLNAPPLSISSQKGYVDGDVSILELVDDALIVRPKEIGASGAMINPPLRASSNYFKVFINDDIIKTHLPVRLERGDSVVTASRGMEFENIQQRTQLFGDVKGLLIPSSKGK